MAFPTWSLVPCTVYYFRVSGGKWTNFTRHMWVYGCIIWVLYPKSKSQPLNRQRVKHSITYLPVVLVKLYPYPPPFTFNFWSNDLDKPKSNIFTSPRISKPIFCGFWGKQTRATTSTAWTKNSNSNDDDIDDTTQRDFHRFFLAVICTRNLQYLGRQVYFDANI